MCGVSKHKLFSARQVRTPLSVIKCTCLLFGPLTSTSVTVAVLPCLSIHSTLPSQFAGLCSLFLIQILSPLANYLPAIFLFLFASAAVLSCAMSSRSLSLSCTASSNCVVSSASCSLSVARALVNSWMVLFLSIKCCFVSSDSSHFSFETMLKKRVFYHRTLGPEPGTCSRGDPIVGTSVRKGSIKLY